MNLIPYLDAVAADLDRATALADDSTRETSRRLLTVLEPGLRLAMVQLLSDAAAQLTSDLGGTVVTVRMDGREPVLVMQSTVHEPTDVEPSAADVEDEGTSRLTVRLPETLKRRAEELAAKAELSLNTWMVQAVRRATAPAVRSPSTPTHTSRRVTGWA